MVELREGVGTMDGQEPTPAVHDHAHDHGGHGHDQPGHMHSHPVRRLATSARVAAPRVRHSMFLASALERLVISVVLIALIWAGIFWAIG
jgi:hypothetical protein